MTAPANRALIDAELVAVTRLREQLGDGVDVGTTLGASRPAITVGVAGGAPRREAVLDEARLSVNAWANTRGEALELCLQAVGALVTPAGNGDGWTAAGVQVHRGRTAMRPVFSFDPVAQVPRYTATVALTARLTR